MALRNLDVDLLRCFVTIADTGSFTRAGERLGRTQSAISLQLKRLEEQLGRTLFVRSPRSLAITPNGERLIGPARQILRLHDATVAEMFEPDIAGSVRIGVPEDFATAHLPSVLAAFAEAHPLVELEVTCDLTLNLLERFHAGHFDLVLVKRQPTQERHEGVRVWREPLVWVARDRKSAVDYSRVPLVVSPEPCVYRKRATEALDAMGRPWRTAYTSTSLAGSLSAVRAGLGITVLPLEMVPSSLTAVGPEAGLPALYDTEIALIEAAGLSDTAHRLAQHIIAALERGRGT
ncbi:transcriptional regulator, LysR family [Novosphingobium aromaticivorans DSM 12444]|uniref:Transcriptional regulator, LysR family n=1 Tax=Novosphingobium aromaticivorans (strain ATCC 700278 / DSM 12444 / CCUG 56034 / CIP 105152 / NBRC 16084 / F199) TaxID=279238 RepID=Q2G5G0_NOVAD|nr:LysR substrate-binding domain-containing protein [Novosphingobium aromaticivorans]ABD26913.1 transcriptional regulator, LysR family [Novosphingobium aromaticivorans DSM 12444]SCY45376.1 transcriptional regulator, LysR family [Novosphingobium aromaticivorans]